MHNDNEIIKAWECCVDPVGKHLCKVCPLHHIQDSCTTFLIKQTLQLFNRQKAEIERLQEENKNHKAVIEAIEDTINPLPFETDFDKAIKTAKTEAIKEYDKRLWTECNKIMNTFTLCWLKGIREQVLKEMVGDENA